MYKKIILFSLAACMAFLTLSSYKNGPAFSGLNLTGSDASPTTCVNAGCHSGGIAAPTVNIRVDSAGGIEVNKYASGKTYTVTVTASHALNNFGFQFAAAIGTGAAQFNAGTFGALPSQVAQRGVAGISILEHTGTIPGPLSKSFTWTAPVTASGDVTMYLTVNAVNSDLNTSGDMSANVSKVLAQYPIPSKVSDVNYELNINAFPNPVTDVLNIQMPDFFNNYTVQVFDPLGRLITEKAITGIACLSTVHWVPGAYNVVVSSQTNRKAIYVVKQ